MELLKVNVERAGTWVLECNSAVAIVASFSRWVEYLVTKQQRAAKGEQERVRRASAAAVAGMMTSAGSSVTNGGVAAQVLQDPSRRLPRDVLLLANSATLEVFAAATRQVRHSSAAAVPHFVDVVAALPVASKELAP